jgi:hypothetical protein
MRAVDDVTRAADGFGQADEWRQHQRYTAIASLLHRRTTAPAQPLPPKPSHVSWPLEFSVLLWRSTVNYVRNPGNVAARLVVYALVSLLQGAAFYDLAEDNVQDRLGSLFFCTLIRGGRPSGG